jgi:Zn-dependent peptidase ImmA (M78 family)
MAFIKKDKSKKIVVSDLPNLTTPDDLISFAEKNGIETDPINIAELAQHLNITTRYEPMDDDQSGSLVKNKKSGQWVMTVNSLHHPHRQRFTMAHEIAHRICHAAQSDEFRDNVFFRNKETNPMEIEANKFASSLLMPKDKFSSFIKNESSKVEDISKFFRVSSIAVRIRAKQLGFSGHNI